MSKQLSKKHETQLKIMNESFAQALEESYQNGITYSQQLNADRENRCYNAGREKGYNEGFEEGYAKGHADGIAECTRKHEEETQKEETKPWHTPVNLSLWIITLKDSALKPEVYIYRATGGVFRPVNNEGRFSIELHDSSIIKAEQIFP